MAPNTSRDDVREVRNYVVALERGIDRLETLPLSLRLVRELHAHLMQGVRGDRATPGEFRRSQDWIGPRGSMPVNAPYVPPPPGEMHEALGAWETFLHRREEFPELVQCALMHEHFEAIHPFPDGNGRVGRLLITLFLIERKRLSQPLLYLFDFIERNRDDYSHGAKSTRRVDRRRIRRRNHRPRLGQALPVARRPGRARRAERSTEPMSETNDDARADAFIVPRIAGSGEADQASRPGHSDAISCSAADRCGI